MPIEIYPLKTRTLLKNFRLLKIIKQIFRQHCLKLKNGDILVISSKILALSQGRLINLKKIKPSEKAKKLAKTRTRYGKGKEDPRFIEIVTREADALLPGNMLLAIKNRVLTPAAGVDRSNAPKGSVILWPENPWGAAREIWQKLRLEFGIKNLGVVICDSCCMPLRWGTNGIAIAWAGFSGVEDIRGKKDIYGKKLRHTKKAVADNLASSAILAMGETDEKIPFVLVRNARVKFCARTQKTDEIFIKPEQCLFEGIYNEKFKAQIRFHNKCQTHSASQS